MLALDRSHGAHHQPQSQLQGPSSSASTNPSRPSMSSASRRSSSHSGQPYDLPPRSRSTPPILPHSGSPFAAGGGPNGGQNAYQQHQQQMQQWHAHQQQQQRQQFGGGVGWNPYGAGAGGAGAPQSQQQQHQQWTQQAMAGLGSPHFLHQQQQQLAAWASVYQQQLMRSGSSPSLPFPNNNGGGSPYGHPADFGPPSHIQDPARRRTTSGPQQQQQQSQRSASADLSSYFPQPSGSNANAATAAAAAHARHNSYSTAQQPHTSQTRQQQQQQQQQQQHQQKPQQQRQESRQPSPPTSEPSNGGLPPQGGGFHPYRRPERKPVPSVSTASPRDSPTPSAANGSDDLGRPTRPYARTADDARSDTSVSSRSSAPRQKSDRERQQAQVATQPAKARGPNAPPADSHARGPSLSSSSASNGSISSLGAVVSPPRQQQQAATADGSGRSSANSSSTQGGSPPRAQGAQAGGKPLAKPSPLSQSQAQNEPVRQPAAPTAVKPAQAPAPVASVAPPAAPEKAKKGFMGKLKGKGKALSTEPGSKANPLIRNVSGPATVAGLTSDSFAAGQPTSPDDATFAAAGDGPGKRGGLKRTRSLFNMKNASTDNISIASAASSASMMIRKIGSFGKLASRNSISGISNIFKDKKSKELDDLDGPGAEKKKGGLSAFRSRKSAPSAAATAHASAELDRPAADTASGLTPAARLARQHTIKSKAADEAEDERRRSTIGDVTEDGRRPSLDVPTAWESTTATQQTNGRQPVQLVDDGFSDSDEDDSRSLDVDDVADRLAGAGIDDRAVDEYADWGTYPVATPPTTPRSILKQHSSYGSAAELEPPQPAWTRMRSNSSDQSISATALGPNILNDLQPDANQIDGVHPGDLHQAHVDSPTSGAAPALPPLQSPTDDPFAATTDKLSFPYQNPAHNSSAPTLSLFSNPPVFNHRSVTAPPGKRKEIAWAPNCAVYHTFHATEYDRRSEPATCNRLTPALAQEIKLFLNHYKMEEMEIHPASKAYTHFFP